MTTLFGSERFALKQSVLLVIIVMVLGGISVWGLLAFTGQPMALGEMIEKRCSGPFSGIDRSTGEPIAIGGITRGMCEMLRAHPPRQSDLAIWDRPPEKPGSTAGLDTMGPDAQKIIMKRYYPNGSDDWNEIDEAIAGLKALKSNVGRTEAGKVDNPFVDGEAAGDQRRSFGVISATMRRYLPLLKSKHRRLLRTAPEAQGKLTIEFVIKADGSVQSAKVLSSAFGNYPDFENEILVGMGKILFEPIPAGEVKVAFPFIFSVND